MGHGFHGYVSHNQMVIISNPPTMPHSSRYQDRFLASECAMPLSASSPLATLSDKGSTGSQLRSSENHRMQKHIKTLQAGSRFQLENKNSSHFPMVHFTHFYCPTCTSPKNPKLQSSTNFLKRSPNGWIAQLPSILGERPPSRIFRSHEVRYFIWSLRTCWGYHMGYSARRCKEQWGAMGFITKQYMWIFGMKYDLIIGKSYMGIS